MTQPQLNVISSLLFQNSFLALFFRVNYGKIRSVKGVLCIVWIMCAADRISTVLCIDSSWRKIVIYIFFTI